ncbi:MAG: hypothetical protein IT559_02840 [Alphaproteobacteria bacterium]|nr:hypothetical protein [Alphaproteobacteria bacterium]
MFGKSLYRKTDKILERLKEFEMFCMGEKYLTPEKFTSLNKELSISTIMHIGKHRYKTLPDGDHFFWTDLDNREHDLGIADDLNIFQECPGFHKTRTHALGNTDVVETRIVDIPSSRRQATMVVMKDGTTGIAPNYKLALRNAALKRHLKTSFKNASGWNIWKKFYGNA